MAGENDATFRFILTEEAAGAGQPGGPSSVGRAPQKTGEQERATEQAVTGTDSAQGRAEASARRRASAGTTGAAAGAGAGTTRATAFGSEGVGAAAARAGAGTTRAPARAGAGIAGAVAGAGSAAARAVGFGGAARAMLSAGSASGVAGAVAAGVGIPIALTAGAMGIASNAESRLADYSPDIAAARARNQALQALQNVRSAGIIGDELGALASTRGEISRNMQAARDQLIEPMLAKLNDLLQVVTFVSGKTAGFFEDNSEGIQKMYQFWEHGHALGWMVKLGRWLDANEQSEGENPFKWVTEKNHVFPPGWDAGDIKGRPAGEIKMPPFHQFGD